MTECITKGYKDILVNMLAKDIGVEILSPLIDSMTLCEEQPVAPAHIPSAAKRKVPARWTNPRGEIIEPIYFDEHGKKHKFDSVSALVSGLGLPMSGTVCDPEGKKCRATSAIEILRIAGYTVSGDGEPEKGVSEKITVWHPDAPQLKKAIEQAEK
jgi:hypothetical protein